MCNIGIGIRGDGGMQAAAETASGRRTDNEEEDKKRRERTSRSGGRFFSSCCFLTVPFLSTGTLPSCLLKIEQAAGIGKCLQADVTFQSHSSLCCN